MDDFLARIMTLGPWRWPLILLLWGIAAALLIWMLRRRAAGKPLGSSRGFTLIEISIVMVIIGLMTTGALKLFQSMAQSGRMTATRTALHIVEEAVIVYGIQNGCLPCPANGALAAGAAGAGRSLDATGTPYTGCTNNGCWATNPVAPWVALGLSEVDSSDAWGHRMSYFLGGVGYTGGTSTCASATALSVEQSNGFALDAFTPTPPPVLPSVACYPAGTLQINNAAAVEQTAGAGNRAVYVIISHGADGFGGWTSTGTQSAAGSNNPNQAANAGAVGPFIQDVTTSIEGATYFDDVVVWATGANAVRKCGAGLCGNPS